LAEKNTLRRKAVEIRCFHIAMTVAVKMVGAGSVESYQENVQSAVASATGRVEKGKKECKPRVGGMPENAASRMA
jgi:hypothetical protein